MKIWHSRYKKFANWMSYRKLSYLAVVLFVISIIPISYLGIYDYATGDDLTYGAAAHQVLVHGGSLKDFIVAIYKDIRHEYLYFQGTWSAGIIWRIEPSVWGEKLYIVTPFIALFSILLGTGYFLYEILVRKLGLEKKIYLIIFMMLSFLTIQYMPYPRAGIFWFTGMILYTFTYFIALMSITWAIRFMDTGLKRYYVGMILAMSFMGGAGYPGVVFATVGYILIMVTAKWTFPDSGRKRTLSLLLPFVLELLGFAVSAMAPGNKIRGGADFGFSFARTAGTLADCLRSGFEGGVSYLIHVRLILLMVIAIIIFVWENLDIDKTKISFRHPILVEVILYLISCSVYAPATYAGENVVAGISGGVYDTYYFVFLLCLVLGVIYLVGWLKTVIGKEKVRQTERKGYAEKVRVPFIILAAMFCILFSRHFVGNSIDYTCIHFATSGQLRDFNEQMQQRLEILENPNIKNVVLPEMNNEQGPFMHFALLKDPDSYTNNLTKEFYGKQSVIAIPRDEWNKKYGK